MKTLFTFLLTLAISISFSQVKITYPSVFNKESKLIEDLSCELNIKMDETDQVKSFHIQEIIQDSVPTREMNLKVTKTQSVFKEGHAGILYHAFDNKNKGYFIYMIDDYCVIYYLPEGKKNFSEAKTLYTLMSGK